MSQSPPEPPEIDGADFFIGIIAARFNGELVDTLLAHVVAKLKGLGVRQRNIEILRVPGSNEIPYAAHMLAATSEFDCLIALGVVVAGDTSHHDVIAYGTAYSLHSIGMQSETPVINGILTVSSIEQARERIDPAGAHDRGAEFARAAVHMSWHKLQLVERLDALEEKSEEFDEEDDDDDDEEDDGFNPKQIFKNN